MPDCDTVTMNNDEDLIQVLAIGSNGHGQWLDYSATGTFLCPISEANSLLHGEIALSSAKKVFKMLFEFLGHDENFSGPETRYVCSQAPDITNVPDIFHKIVATVLNRNNIGRITIDLSRGDEDCGNPVVVLMMLVKNLLADDEEESRVTRDISSLVTNQITDYFEADNLRKLSSSLDVEELNLSKLFRNQIVMRAYWTRFSRFVDNSTENMLSEIQGLNERLEDLDQQSNLGSFVEQMRAISSLYFSHLSSGSFYNTNTYVFLSQALLGGASSLHGGKQCQFYKYRLLCHLSLPIYNYLPVEKVLSVSLYAEDVIFDHGQVFKCVPKFPHGMTSLRNNRVIINHDEHYQVVQTDDSKLYRNNTVEEFQKQHLISSPWKCFFNGGSLQFVVSCESESTITLRNKNKSILPQFQAMKISKDDFPLTINGLELPIDKVVTQIVHSNALNVASELYTSVSATPSQFHQVLQNFEFESDNEPLDFKMVWRHPDGKTYITITSVVIGLLALIGLVWSCNRCCKRFVPRIKGYKLQLPIKGTRENDDVEFSDRQIRSPSAPDLESSESGRNVTFATRDQSTSVFPRGRRVRN